MNILVPIVLVLLIVLFFKVRLSTPGSAKTKKSKKGRKPKPSHKNIPEKMPFGAVSLEFSEDACPAVHKLKGQKILQWAAPIIPLSKCTCSKCRCRYVHCNDRRSQEKRRDPLEIGRRLFETQSLGDQRSKHERRGVDSTKNLKNCSYNELSDAAAQTEV
jgi:hypothetical protein